MYHSGGIAHLSGDKNKAGSPTEKERSSLISILCTIQVSSVGSAAAINSYTGEILNTLKFAARAKASPLWRQQIVPPAAACLVRELAR